MISIHAKKRITFLQLITGHNQINPKSIFDNNYRYYYILSKECCYFSRSVDINTFFVFKQGRGLYPTT